MKTQTLKIVGGSIILTVVSGCGFVGGTDGKTLTTFGISRWTDGQTQQEIGIGKGMDNNLSMARPNTFGNRSPAASAAFNGDN